MLKGPLAPGRKNAKVFGDFGHRPMSHSVVVGTNWIGGISEFAEASRGEGCNIRLCLDVIGFTSIHTCWDRNPSYELL